MASKARTLFDNGTHKVLCFDQLVSGDGVQANQFLIIDHDQHALLDPGGDLTYMPLALAVSDYIPLKKLTYVFASHQDPDIIASLDKWFLHTGCRVVCSKLWARFLPHLSAGYLSQLQGQNTTDRMIAVPDAGQEIPLGKTSIKALPAHFLHSVGNLHFYDPVSNILFSGDMGASLVDDAEPVTDFAAHIPSMLGFHKRYMGGNKVCRLWANMIRQLNPGMIVPQHGRAFCGEKMVHQFLDWISELECGMDLLDQRDYRLF
ncbi:oxygen-binding di-iron domain-containing protein [Cellvibrio polysaccharolyticus]|uniref:FprA family A-type flavoprotein n=1 Tax=Cellvibrio polysaccharolyticus TaxID=2082724 RepID=A0A928V2V5_9GAMM|nr:MBL fold metallo-hydrolase [Cellvibrio polysaccharolyticus]MBE8717277.1 FprA family A-type flavoprotein [Cellvibrio polysaccharolyticus]